MKPALLPGDCLLYKPSDMFGLLIAVKTWNRISHVEVYAGNDTSVASRNGIGVNRYPVRWNDLSHVLRPPLSFDFVTAMAWFIRYAKGQKYDWKGLLCFTLAEMHGAKDRMFCSEFATRFYRMGGFEPFQPDYDADHVAPANFLISEPMKPIWVKGK